MLDHFTLNGCPLTLQERERDDVRHPQEIARIEVTPDDNRPWVARDLLPNSAQLVALVSRVQAVIQVEVEDAYWAHRTLHGDRERDPYAIVKMKVMTA